MGNNLIFFVKKTNQKRLKRSETCASQFANVSYMSGRHFLFFKWDVVRDFAWSGLWVAVCFCWPADLWFLPERAFKTGRVSGFGLFCSHFIFLGVSLCSALYHFMFASCINSCGGVKGSGWPRHFPGTWGPLCYTDGGKKRVEK